MKLCHAPRVLFYDMYQEMGVGSEHYINFKKEKRYDINE